MKNKYKALCWWSEEDGAYIAEVPDLPGCMADGSNMEQLQENLEVIIRQWMEAARSMGRPIPPPRALSTFEVESPELIAA